MPLIQRIRSPEALLRISLWAVLVAVLSFTRADPDLWGHVRFGADILRDFSLADRDPYSFTSDQPWVNHEWLSEVTMGTAYEAAGAAGLVFLKLVVVLGFILLLCRTLRQEGVSVPRLRDYLAGVAIIVTVQQAHHVRPQIFSLLLFALLLTCLVEAHRDDRRWLVPVPILFALWVNFHGGWIVGGAVLLVWTITLAMSGAARAAAAFACAGATSLLATLANPYGIGMWRFLRETVGFGRADITEWQPVYVGGAGVWLPWTLTAALAAVGMLRARRSALDPVRVSVIVLLAAASFRVSRLLAFFGIATLFLFGHAIAESFAREKRTSRAETPTTRIVAGTMSAILIVAGAVFTAVNLLCIRIDPRLTPDAGAMNFLKAGPGGRLLVWFDWGEYALWHLAPRFKVSVDGRRETTYSADLQERHLRFFFDAPGGATLPDELRADYVWIPRDLPASRRLSSTGWSEVYRDADSVVFTRARTVDVRPDAPPANSNGAVAWRCFPGP